MENATWEFVIAPSFVKISSEKIQESSIIFCVCERVRELMYYPVGFLPSFFFLAEKKTTHTHKQVTPPKSREKHVDDL